MKLDFKEPKKRERFPQHGWAVNSEGMRLIWLPIMRAIANSQKIRSNLGLSTKMGSTQRADIDSLFATLDNLSATLRELAIVMRELDSLDPIEGDNESMNRQLYLCGLIKLYVDVCVMYLRRLSDAFCRSLRYVLFDHFESAPRELKRLIDVAANDEGKLVKAGLVCDVCRLKSVLGENTEWFRDIRGMNRDGSGKKGIRDVLEHHSSSIEIHRESLDEGPWRTRALLHYVSERNPMSLDLLVLTEKLISQLCGLWTELYRILPLPRDSQGYKAGANMREGDIYLVLGDDMDVTHLWPPI